MANFHHILVHFLSVCDLAAVVAAIASLPHSQQPQKTRRNSIEWSSLLSSPFDYYYYFSSAQLSVSVTSSALCVTFLEAF